MVVRRAGAPLLRAAVVGGTAYAAGRAGARHSQREADQDAAIADMQAQQAYAQAQPPPPAVGSDITAQLKQLADLKASGVLSYEEFEAAKRKLLGS
jgi:Short C-terminal domain